MEIMEHAKESGEGAGQSEWTADGIDNAVDGDETQGQKDRTGGENRSPEDEKGDEVERNGVASECDKRRIVVIQA